MFKALKGKAATALEAAATAAPTTSDPTSSQPQTSDGDLKLNELQNKITAKDETITKLTERLKKYEETEAKLDNDMKKKDAELNRVNKLLEQSKAEGNEAAAVIENEKTAVQTILNETQALLDAANLSLERKTLELEGMSDNLGRHEMLAEGSKVVEVKLKEAGLAIEEQELKYKARITTLRQQLEVADRKVTNAKYLSESHEHLSAQAQMLQRTSTAKAAETERLLQRSLEKYASLEHDLKVQKLTLQCVDGKRGIKETEQGIRECYSDPLLKVPAGTAKRRQLKNLEDRLKELRAKQKSQSEFLNQLTNIADLDEELRNAANNDDIAAVKRLMKQGCSCNAPDKTGFSAFKYACGQGRVEVLRVMLEGLENDVDVIDEDGRMTGLILAAKNAHDNAVRLLVKKGAAIEARDVGGRTALICACDNGNRTTVTTLLDLNADINASDNKGNTSLHYCSLNNFASIARILLDRGADTEVVNVASLTAAKIAMGEKNQRIVETLMEHEKVRNELERGNKRVSMDEEGFTRVMEEAAAVGDGGGRGGDLERGGSTRRKERRSAVAQSKGSSSGNSSSSHRLKRLPSRSVVSNPGVPGV